MNIREMSKDECIGFLKQSRVARLGCAHENQPYVVPVHLIYDDSTGCFYGFATAGQKIDWMRANPLVCVEVDEIVTPEEWVDVIAFGRYEEIVGSLGNDVAMGRPPERPQEENDSFASWSGDRHLRQWDDEVVHDERAHAMSILQRLPRWWQPGSASWSARHQAHIDEPLNAIYYKIRIDRLTGYLASGDPSIPNFRATATPTGISGWLRGILTRKTVN